MLDNFDNPIENLELIEANKNKIYKTDSKGKVIVKVKKDEYYNYSYSKEGYNSGNINVNASEENKKVIVYKQPLEKGIFYIDLNNKRYVKLSEGDFKEEYYRPQFTWDGPLSFSYYYPASKIQELSKNIKNSILFYKVPFNDFHFINLFEDGYFIKNTKFFLNDPVTEAIVVKVEIDAINNEFVLINNLKPNKYIIVKKGEGIGNFSNSANKPFYYFEIK